MQLTLLSIVLAISTGVLAVLVVVFIALYIVELNKNLEVPDEENFDGHDVGETPSKVMFEDVFPGQKRVVEAAHVTRPGFRVEVSVSEVPGSGSSVVLAVPTQQGLSLSRGGLAHRATTEVDGPSSTSAVVDGAMVWDAESTRWVVLTVQYTHVTRTVSVLQRHGQISESTSEMAWDGPAVTIFERTGLEMNPMQHATGRYLIMPSPSAACLLVPSGALSEIIWLRRTSSLTWSAVTVSAGEAKSIDVLLREDNAIIVATHQDRTSVFASTNAGAVWSSGLEVGSGVVATDARLAWRLPGQAILTVRDATHQRCFVQGSRFPVEVWTEIGTGAVRLGTSDLPFACVMDGGRNRITAILPMSAEESATVIVRVYELDDMAIHSTTTIDLRTMFPSIQDGSDVRTTVTDAVLTRDSLCFSFSQQKTAMSSESLLVHSGLVSIHYPSLDTASVVGTALQPSANAPASLKQTFCRIQRSSSNMQCGVVSGNFQTDAETGGNWSNSQSRATRLDQRLRVEHFVPAKQG